VALEIRRRAASAVRWIPPLTAMVGLVTCWGIVYHVDIALNPIAWAQMNALGMAWYALFSEGGVVENAQWLLLATALSVALWCWAQILVQNPRSSLRTPVFLLAAGLALMLIEDSLNLRHMVSDRVLANAFFVEPLPSHVRMTWETSFYLALAGTMLASMVLIWRRGALSRSTLALVVVAYATYGLVGFGSALRRLGDWQERLGAYIIARFELLGLPNWADAAQRIEGWRAADPDYTYTIGYFLVDLLVEESVELIAASLLTAAVISVFQETRIVRYQEVPART